MTERQGNGPVDDGQNGSRAESDLTESEVAVDAAMLADLEATLENTRAELAQASDRLLRLAAEYDNYRKRTERERADMIPRAQADLVARIVDVLDDLERVGDYDENTPSAALLEGVQLVEKKMRTVLQAAGLEPVDALGTLFDPATMEGIAMLAAETPEEEDMVSDVFQQGYRFRGHLVRPARVRVKKYGA